jgi:hypothetical protein
MCYWVPHVVVLMRESTPKDDTAWSKSSLAEAACKTLATVLWKASAQGLPRVRGQQHVFLDPHLCDPRRSRPSTRRTSFLPDLKNLHLLLLPDRRRCLRSGITVLPLGIAGTGSSKARPLCSSSHSPRDKRICTSIGMLSNRCLTFGLFTTFFAGAVTLRSRSQKIGCSPPRCC